MIWRVCVCVCVCVCGGDAVSSEVLSLHNRSCKYVYIMSKLSHVQAIHVIGSAYHVYF